MDKSILDEEDQPMEGPVSLSLAQSLDEIENRETFDLTQDETDLLLTPMVELCVGQNPNGGQEQLLEDLAAKQDVTPPEQRPPLLLPPTPESNYQVLPP